MDEFNLSPELREEHNTRSLPVRKGDTVKVRRGDFKDHEGKVDGIDLKHYRVMIEGLNVQKPDGNQVYHPVPPSNLMIVDIDLDEW